MKETMIQVICGPGRGKSTGAIGRGVSALTRGRSVIMVQFLKGSLDSSNTEVIKRLEPEFKVFRFEKSTCVFDQLSEREKEDARSNIRNGLNFAKKVLVTGECDLLILDEILAILDEGIITVQELRNIVSQAREGSVEMILTGNVFPRELEDCVDEITWIQTRYHSGQEDIG